MVEVKLKALEVSRINACEPAKEKHISLFGNNGGIAIVIDDTEFCLDRVQFRAALKMFHDLDQIERKERSRRNRILKKINNGRNNRF